MKCQNPKAEALQTPIDGGFFVFFFLIESDWFMRIGLVSEMGERVLVRQRRSKKACNVLFVFFKYIRLWLDFFPFA